MPSAMRQKSNRLFAQIVALGAVILALIFVLTYKIYNYAFSAVGEFAASEAHALCGCATFSSPRHTALTGLIVAVGATLLVAVLIALGRAIFTWHQTKKFVTKQKFNLVKNSRKLAQISAELGLNEKVKEIKTDKPIVFCHGLKSPDIYVSAAVADCLNYSELRAVILHETQHLLAKEPARMLIIKFINTFRFIPGINGLTKKYLTLSELSADELATNNFTEKNNLARAMRKILEMEEKSIIQKELALAYFSAVTEERVLALSETNYRPGIKKEIAKAVFGLALAGAFVLFFGSEIKAQENHAKQFYSASPCAKQIQEIERCENNWTKCAGKVYHKEKNNCAKAIKYFDALKK